MEAGATNEGKVRFSCGTGFQAGGNELRDDLARLVNPIVRVALDLRDGWGSPGGPNFDAGRSRLHDRFRDLHRSYPAVRGDGVRASAGDLLDGGFDLEPEDTYLGPAYPLACWADEMFTRMPAVAAKWTDRKFEVEFHGTNDRAWRFWKQAELASRRSADELEVFFVCAALGFRGDKIEDPTDYAGWAAVTRDRLLAEAGVEWIGPPALDPPARVPPRLGSRRLKRMAATAAAFAVVAIPVAAWLVARQLVR